MGMCALCSEPRVGAAEAIERVDKRLNGVVRRFNFLVNV